MMAGSSEAEALEAVRVLLRFIGEDPTREGLLNTPYRVLKSFQHIFSGYHSDPTVLIRTFSKDTYDQMILLRDIELYSICEHHWLPFFGRAHIAYIPKDQVIGISKLARLVDMFSRRMQIQERIGEQITHFIMDKFEAIGAACLIEADHLCMRMRGVEKQNSVMVTSSLKGVFLEQSQRGMAARSELMTLVKK